MLTGNSRHVFSGWSPLGVLKQALLSGRLPSFYLNSKCHCRAVLQQRAGIPCPGTVVTKAWGLHRPELPPGFLQVPVQVTFACVLFCLFSQKNSPKTNEARSKCQHGILAPVRLQDLRLFQKEEACEGCGSCRGNATGVLQQGDLHSFWQELHPANQSGSRNIPFCQFPFPPSLQETSQSAGSREIGEVKGKGF